MRVVRMGNTLAAPKDGLVELDPHRERRVRGFGPNGVSALGIVDEAGPNREHREKLAGDVEPGVAGVARDNPTGKGIGQLTLGLRVTITDQREPENEQVDSQRSP